MSRGVNFLTICALVFAACGNKQQQVKARIFERKEVSSNKLLIRYHYTYHGKIYNDSATVQNEIISTDSIDILINPSKPVETTLAINN